MAKKKIEFAPKGTKIEEAIPLFISSQNAKGLSEKTLNNYQGHFRSIAYQQAREKGGFPPLVK